MIYEYISPVWFSCVAMFNTADTAKASIYVESKTHASLKQALASLISFKSLQGLLDGGWLNVSIDHVETATALVFMYESLLCLERLQTLDAEKLTPTEPAVLSKYFSLSMSGTP